MKTLKGIISDWRQEDQMIFGKCVWHADAVPVERAIMSPGNPIATGHGMHTSEVVAIKDGPSDQFSIAETRNSFYILLNKAA